jgi:hypothetical protein
MAHSDETRQKISKTRSAQEAEKRRLRTVETGQGRPPRLELPPKLRRSFEPAKARKAILPAVKPEE